MMNSLMEIQEKLMQEKISKRQKELPLEPKQEVIEDIPEIKQKVVKEPPTIKPETETAFEMDTVKAAGVTEEDILKFRKPKSEGGRGTSEEFRKALKGRNPELQELANKVKEGKIPVQEYRSRADEVRPIRLVSEVPEPATNKEIVSALNSKQRQNPIIGLNATIPEKDIVEVRLNIPAYTDYDVWIPTIRHSGKEKYKAAVRIKNVEFIQPESSGSRKALRIAQGGEKNPFAVMKGEYVDGSDDELFNMAKEAFDSKLWTQVGYDPIKRGFFYARETGEPILSAEEVIQVGHLVLAKKAVKGKVEDFAFNQGGLAVSDLEEFASKLIGRQGEPLILDENVGENTGEVTKVGRPKKRTPKGETVSEKSTTIEIDGKHYNLPTIYGNKRYSDFVLKRALIEGVIKETSVHDSREEAEEAAERRSKGLNQGGTMLGQQTEMAFMNEGGMKDDGGKTEPTSGNKVPSGSLEEEVADDIPAMLSEGEFVFPADVVRYIGLGTLMKMRQDAKQGLKMMEKMGQLGNPEEAEIPDDIPFGMADLVVISGEMEDKEKKAEGGAVGLQEGGMPTKQPDPEFYESDAYKRYQDDEGFTAQVMTEASDGTVFGNPSLARAYDEYLKTKRDEPRGGGSLLDDPRFQTGDSGQDPTTYTEEEAQQIKESLQDTIVPADIEIKRLVNPEDPEDFIMHPFKDGEPLTPIPEGYVIDDTPLEEQYGTLPRRGRDTGDSGGSDDGEAADRTIFDKMEDAQKEIDKLKDIPESIDTDILSQMAGKGNRYTLTANGKPISLQKDTFDSLVRDYEALQKVEGVKKMSFADYYNLPTFTKVGFALQTNFGIKPSVAQVNAAIEKAKTNPRAVIGPISAIINSISPNADGSKIDSGYIKERSVRLQSINNLNSLLEGNSPYEVNAQGALTSKGYDQYLKDRFSISGAKFDDDPTKGIFSNFLSGTRRNKNDGTIEIFSKGKFVPLTANILKGLEENRQKTTTRRLTTQSLLAKNPLAKATVKKDPTLKDPTSEQIEATNRDLAARKKAAEAAEAEKRRKEEEAQAVEEQRIKDEERMRQSQIRTGGDSSGSGGRGGDGNRSGTAGSGVDMSYQGEFTGVSTPTPKTDTYADLTGNPFGDRGRTQTSTYTSPSYSELTGNPFGRSKGGLAKMYVGGVPTKPMKPQRLKKGGLAKPKAKPKKMKKGGLASSRKK